MWTLVLCREEAAAFAADASQRQYGTWTGAFRLDPPSVAEADGAVGMRVGQQSLAEVVNPLIQLIWNVGRLENRKHMPQTHALVSVGKSQNKDHNFSFTVKCEPNYLLSRCDTSLITKFLCLIVMEKNKTSSSTTTTF